MVPKHALQRAFERCPGVCPGVLLKGLHKAIVNGDGNLAEFVAVVRRRDFADLYRFRTASGQTRYAIACTPTGFVVTILEPGREIWTDRGKFMLGESGLEGCLE